MDDGEISEVLQRLEGGDGDASGELMGLVYRELRKLARGYMNGERPDHTLQATALVHEAYLKLLGQSQPRWESRSHFFGAAARAMRQILVDHARGLATVKRGGGWKRQKLSRADRAGEMPSLDLLDLDDALTRLEEHDAVKARVVELRYFAGLSVEEVAKILGITSRSVVRYWRYSQAWLAAELSDDGRDTESEDTK